jgi:hypothetical protein
LFIDITPAPCFAWLEGLDDGMLGRVKMLGRVPVGRAIAAAYMATNQANTEMDPPAADFQAIFTALGAGGNLLDLTYMHAFHFKLLLINRA